MDTWTLAFLGTQVLLLSGLLTRNFFLFPIVIAVFDVGSDADADNALVNPWTGGSFGVARTFDESNPMNNAN